MAALNAIGAVFSLGGVMSTLTWVALIGWNYTYGVNFIGFLAYGLLSLVLVYGLWRGKPWARYTIALLLMTLIASWVAFIRSDPSVVAYVIPIVFHIVSLVYIRSNRVGKYFHALGTEYESDETRVY